jgi:hypothetical protein
MSYGSDYHSHPEYASDRHDHHEIDEVRYDAQRELRDLQEQMWAMRRELTDFIRTEVNGLSEWIGGVSESVIEVNRRVDRISQTHPVAAKDGGRS